MFSSEITDLTKSLIQHLNNMGWTIATAESCTGGLVAAALTSVAGSSSVVHGGFVTYANRAKMDMLGVNQTSLQAEGAVSEIVAREMAKGARKNAKVDMAIAITGVAGPGGGSAEKPVGLVHISVATANGTTHEEHQFGDIGRDAVRQATVIAALKLALQAMDARSY